MFMNMNELISFYALNDYETIIYAMFYTHAYVNVVTNSNIVNSLLSMLMKSCV